MKAYELAMAMIFVNAGIYLVDILGCFGDLSPATGIFLQLTVFSNPIVTVGGVTIRGIEAIAAALALGTVVVVNTNAINDRGIAYSVFSIVFWGSFVISSVVISKFKLPGIEIFYTILFLASVHIFIMTFVQMPTGGQKSYV